MSDIDIKADYEDLQRISSQFGNRGEDLHRMMHNIEAKVNELQSGGWLGEGARAFYMEMHNDVLPALTRLFQAMELAQQNTQTIRTEFSNAEEEASQCVRFSLDN